MSKTLVFLFLTPLIFGCKNQPPPHVGSKSDTALVLQVALRTAFMDHKLPETGSLFQGHFFNDSIFVVTDSLFRQFFPATLDTIKFEFGSRQAFMDRLRNVHDTLKPNYLYVCCFERTDTGYSIPFRATASIH